MSLARDEIGIAELNDKIYFAGGFSWSPFRHSNLVDIYDLKTENWITDTLSVPRDKMQAATIRNKVFFIGRSGNPNYSKRIDIYDQSLGVWSTMELPNARYNKAITTLNEKLFVGGDEFIDIYDNQPNTWDIFQLPIPRSSMCAVIVNDKVIFAGGSNSVQNLNSVDIYDQNTNTWIQDSLSIARSSMGCTSIGSRAYFAGRIRDDYSATNIIDIYYAETESWSIDTLSIPRFGLAATSTKDNLYFAGGRINGDWSSIWYSTVDILDVNTGEWSVENLSEKKVYVSAIGIDDKVFFAGGRLESGNSNKLEIYQATISSTHENDTHRYDTSLSMFPNPTDGELSIHLNESEIEEIRIYDQMGVLLSVYEAEEVINSNLDLSDFPSNLYIVIAKTKDQTFYIGKVSVLK